jgi:hypothetical protein
MKHLNHFLAAMSLALVPGVALAQSVSGYRIPEVHTATQPQLHSADDVDLSQPGDGYRIPEAHTATQSQLHSADDADLSQPGDGYRIPDAKAPYAPSEPAMNDNGTYPSYARHD